MRLMAATTAGALAADPASTTTTPSSPTCTPTLAPPPAITKKLSRTFSTSTPAGVCADVAAISAAHIAPVTIVLVTLITAPLLPGDGGPVGGGRRDELIGPVREFAVEVQFLGGPNRNGA
jgi:hypothetical protein